MRRSRRPGIAAAAGRASGRGPGEGRTLDHRGTGPAGAAGCMGEGSPAGRMELGADRMAAGRSLAAAAVPRVSAKLQGSDKNDAGVI